MTRQAFHFRASAWLALVAGAFVAAPIAAQPAATGTWTATADGFWNTGSNWLGGAVPTSAATTAVLKFNAGGATTYTATNDIGPFSMLQLVLSSNSSNPITLADNGSNNALTFAANGTVASIYQNGSGAVTIGNPLTLTNSSASSNDANVGGTGSGTVTFTGLISGAGGLNFGSWNGATFVLTNGSNSFGAGLTTGAFQMTNPTTTVIATATSGTPLGVGAIQMQAGTIVIAPSGSGADVSVGTSTTRNFNVLASGRVVLDKGGNNSLTFTSSVFNPTESGNSEGALVIAPAGGIANLGLINTGTGFPVAEAFAFTTAPTVVNNMVSPTQIGQASRTNSAGDFLTYGAAGYNGYSQFQNYTNYNTAGGNFSSDTTNTEVSNVTAATTTNASPSIQALRVTNTTLTIATGNTVTIGGQAWVAGRPLAGLILNSATIGGAGTLNYGNADLAIYGSGVSTISAQITNTANASAPPMVKFGPGSVFFTNPNNLISGTATIYDGSLGIIGPGGSNQTTVFGSGVHGFVLRGGSFEVKGGDYAPAANTLSFLFVQGGGGLIVDDTSTLTLAQTGQFGSVGSVGAEGPFFKGGTGTLALNAAYSLTGLTAVAVNQGKLQVDAALTGAPSTTAGLFYNVPAVVNNTATLAGTGSLPGIVTINSGGTIAPGVTGISAFGTGGVVFEPGGTFRVKYNPGTTSPVAGTTGNDELTGAVISPGSGGVSSPGTLDLTNLSAANPFTINVLPAVIGTSAGSTVTYTIGSFASAIALPAGITSANLSTLFNVTGSFNGTPTLSLDSTLKQLQISFIPVSLSTFNWTGATNGQWSIGNNWLAAGQNIAPASSTDTVIVFGAGSNTATTNDIIGLVINSIQVSSGAPAYSVAGNAITFQTSSVGATPQITSSSANGFTVSAPLTLTNNFSVNGSGSVTINGAISGPGNLTVNGSGNVTINGFISGTGNVTMAGTGTLTLSNPSNLISNLVFQSGTIAVTTDAALGINNTITGTALGTLNFAGTTSTSRTFNMNSGTISVAGSQTVTFNGALISSATLDGSGTFATDPTNGARFVSVTTTPSATVASKSAADQFSHFTNNGTLNVAAGVNTAASAANVSFNGFTNEGSGSITVGQNSAVNVANFQSYGTLTLNPGTFNGSSGNFTQLINLGSSKLFFDGGSRTFISTAAQAPNINAGIDLHGNDAVVAGGLLVNNGYVIDSTGGGHRIVADFGAVVKGAGFYQTIPQTINGGTFSTGNSPGGATAGAIVLGGPNDPNLGLSNYTWQINDAGPSATYPTATGTAGPTANAAKQVSGWGLLTAVAGTSPVVTTGNFDWDATPTDKLTIHLTTLLAPNDVNGNTVAGGGYGQTGDNTAGLMSDFDPTKSYVWKLFAYQGTYTGPTDTATLDASTAIDDSGFLNPHNGRFDLVLNQSSQEMDLTFTPTAVPEPGTLSLLGLAGLGLAAAARRRKAKKAAAAVALAMCCLFPAASRAQPYSLTPTSTWTSGATSNWANAANWTPAVAPPANSTSTVLQFNATGTTSYNATNDIMDPVTALGVQFNSSSTGAINLAGGGLNFSNIISNPAFILQMSSGPVNIANNVVSNAASQTPFNLQLGGFGSGPVNISGQITGAGGINLVNAGGATFTLSNPNNAFAASTLVAGINLTAPGAKLVLTTTTGPFDMSSPTNDNAGTEFTAGTLVLAPQSVIGVTDPVLNLTTGTALFTLNAGGTMVLDKGTNNSLTAVLRVLVRTVGTSSSGTLVIAPASGIANLGSPTGENVQTTVFQTNVNGIIVPVVVGQASATDTTGDFLQSNALGLGGAFAQFQGYTTYNTSGGSFSTSTAGTEVSNVTVNTTASAPATLAALRVTNSTFVINVGNTVNVAGGVFSTGYTQAGLILNNSTISGGTLAFSSTQASTEADVYVSAGTSTISSLISVTNTGTATPALVKFGPGTLLLTNPANTFGSGSITLYGGTLAIQGPGGSNDATVLGTGARNIFLRGGGFEVMNGDYAPAAGTKTFTVGTGGGTIQVDDTSTFTLAQANQFAPAGGVGPFFKTGTGTLVLSNSTYPLENLTAIVVNGGQLRLNMSRAAAVLPIQVNSGGTLAGAATLGATVQVAGTIAPGTPASAGSAGAIGTFTDVGNVFLPGGAYAFKYNPGVTTPRPSNGSDLLASGTGPLNLSNLSATAPFTLNLAPAVVGASSAAPITYTAATFGSVVLPAGFSGTNLTSLFNFTGSFAGTPTATLDSATSPTRLMVTFVPKTLNNSSWTGASSGNWSDGGSWAEGTPPAGGQNTQLTFGASSQAAMTNDIPGLVIDGVLVNSGAPAYTVGGNPIAFQSSTAGTAPQITSNSANGFTVNVPLTLTNSLTVNGSGNITLNGAVTGPGGINVTGTGTLTLGSTGNNFATLNIQNGTVAVASDAALGAGNTVTGAAPGTVNFTGTTTTARTFNMNSGTISVAGSQTVTFNGGTVSGAYLDGSGTFATDPTNGARFVSVTTTPSATVASKSAADQFSHFTNNGTLNVAAGVNTAASAANVSFNGFTNEGSGSITVGQNSAVNVANFQSYGTLTLNPGTFNGSSGNFTQLINLGSSKLFFDGGSRTFISTAAQAPNINAGIDLHGNDAVVAGGLLVNNGYVIDSTGGGHRIVADFGAVVKGAGFYQTIPQTINGGTFSTGNSPGGATAGAIVLGGPNDPNLGLSNYTWQINDAGPSATYPTATGTAGPTANAAKQVSGWGLLTAVAGTSPVVTTGNFDWDATPTDKLTIHLTTLLAPNDVNGNTVAGGGYGQTGDNTAGLMSDFDPTKSYVWKLFAYQGTYTGPTDTATLDASTAIDDSGFLNPHNGRFDLVLNQSSQEMDLTFTPTAVPEPGTLSLLGLAGLGLAAAARRRKAKKAAA